MLHVGMMFENHHLYQKRWLPPVVKHSHCRSTLESREQHQDKSNMQLCTLELKTQLKGDLSSPMTGVTQVIHRCEQIGLNNLEQFQSGKLIVLLQPKGAIVTVGLWSNVHARTSS